MQIANEDFAGGIPPVDVAISDLHRWEVAGRRLESVAPEVLTEVFAIGIEPNKLRLSLAANAARYAARVADEPLKTEAVALAEELEHRAA
jgi:hypothetical protein